MYLPLNFEEALRTRELLVKIHAQLEGNHGITVGVNHGHRRAN